MSLALRPEVSPADPPPAQLQTKYTRTHTCVHVGIGKRTHVSIHKQSHTYTHKPTYIHTTGIFKMNPYKLL